MTTLTQWLAAQTVDPKLASVVATMAAASAEIAGVLRLAPIAGQTGLAGHTNVQGEAQKALDVISNDIVLKHLKDNDKISILVSEELDEEVRFGNDGQYFVATDPLDGSSNLDVNVTVGTIFSVLDARKGLLQKGSEQLAAGYAAYGPATSLVITFGTGVAIFTLDGSGAFVLTQDQVAVPAASGEYAINTARERFWDAATKAYVAENVAGETGTAGKRYNMRWVGSMVADIHRILMRGGIFLYPLDSETVSKGGRLRLLYEANPMAMIVEAAGGKSTTGPEKILELVPSGIHQRVPVILGSADEVERVEAWYKKG
ncbi:MAG: class 1 fructose-bisphosphatase [Candidatus Devosia phytovorans]|uniref:Fructose-1,6-bisphosphatase class 1 n=1 Tax=Candidatus Devosia phytovorans TaxID=3121372 RepID=A0AAJ5VQ51_9HYPH|nr:class 1 fructose-bisphosphatase [Devosia sp.]WEK02696.1 MAG: class 1 fructose-bisphosphatase [Devosia sp.]